MNQECLDPRQFTFPPKFLWLSSQEIKAFQNTPRYKPVGNFSQKFHGAFVLSFAYKEFSVYLAYINYTLNSNWQLTHVLPSRCTICEFENFYAVFVRKVLDPVNTCFSTVYWHGLEKQWTRVTCNWIRIWDAHYTLCEWQTSYESYFSFIRQTQRCVTNEITEVRT